MIRTWWTRSRKWLVVLAIIATGLIISVIVTHQRSDSHKQAEDLWYRALSNTLMLKSVTCTADDSQSGGTFHQSVQMNLESKTDLHSSLTTNENGQKIAIEEIDSSTATYVRYTDIVTNKRTDTGQTPDLSNLIGVWSKTDTAGQSALFGRTALGNCVVPLVHLSQPQTNQRIAQLRKNTIFQTDTSMSKRSKIGTASVRIYEVTVAPSAYISFMKAVGVDYGSSILATVSTPSYAQRTPQKLSVAVDERSGRIIQIDFLSSKRVLRLSDYDQELRQTVPSDVVSADELQRRFQAVQ